MTTDSPCWYVYVLRNPDGKLYIGQSRNLASRAPAQRPSAYIDANDEALSRPVGTCAFRNRSIAISCSRAREGAEIRPGQSVAEEFSRLLIRLRRIVGSNPTSGAIRRACGLLMACGQLRVKSCVSRKPRVEWSRACRGTHRLYKSWVYVPATSTWGAR